MAVTTSTVVAVSAGVVGMTAQRAGAFAPALQCPPEQYPAAGSPRSASSRLYEAPVNAELGTPATAAGGSEGGYVAVNGNLSGPGSTGAALSIVLGPKGTYDGNVYTMGTLFGNACGTFNIPYLTGSLPQGGPGPDPGNPDYNHNFILHGPPYLATADALAHPDDATVKRILATPIPVAIEVPGTGVPIVPLSGTGSASGSISANIQPTSAANGGLNFSFGASAKATASISASILTSILPSQATSLLPPSVLGQLGSLVSQLNTNGPAECSLVLGDARTTGYPAADVGPYTSPAVVSTDPTVSAAARAAGAKPITGPITDATGVGVSTGILQPPVEAGTTPDPAAPGAGTADPTTLCNPTVASLLNSLFGLPASPTATPVAADTFVAPVTVHTYVSQ